MAWKPFQWSDEYEIGIPAIDQQHRKLLDLANQVHHQMRSSRRHVEGAMEELMAYVQFHFAAEERLMAENGYAGLADHRRAHEALADQVVQLWRVRDVVTPEQVFDLLSEWVVAHILSCDQDLRGMNRGAPPQP